MLPVLVRCYTFTRGEVMAKVLKGDFSQKQRLTIPQGSTEGPIPGYQLKLAVAFSDPLIWRTIQVPGNMTLAILHKVIQVCMGWDDTHTHQFLVGKIFYQSGFGIKDMKEELQYDENNFELHQLEEGMQFIFTYLYDGGEGWELEITLEETIRTGLGHDFPVLIGGERACPPAEVGDVHQYQKLLNDAEAGGRTNRLDLNLPLMEDFDPDSFDLKALKGQLSLIK